MEKRAYTRKVSGGSAFLGKGRIPLLRQLDIELTERCDNNCIHCYINLPTDDHEARERELSTEAWKRILNEAGSLGCLEVRLTGGEPLLREDFEEIYVHARRLGIKVLIFTNARRITPHLADLLSRIPPLIEMEVSLYGIKKETYEAVTRVQGSFEEAWRGVNLLIDKKIPFLVKNALLPPNKKETREFESWAMALPWMKKLPLYSVYFDLHARRNPEKNRLISKLRIPPKEVVAFLSGRDENIFKEMNELISRFSIPQNKSLFTCGAGRGSGSVDAYGRFQPCLPLRCPKTTYDLKRGSLQDALLNFFPKVRGLKASNKDYINRCARCFLRAVCEQCPAKSWMEYGTLDTPVEYSCALTHEQARQAGMLKEDENAWEVEDWKKRIITSQTMLRSRSFNDMGQKEESET